MKIGKDFMLCTVAGENVVVPVGEASAKLKGVIKLNESGGILWNLLADGADLDKLATGLIAYYGISQKEAKQDVSDFLDTLRKAGCLEE